MRPVWMAKSDAAVLGVPYMYTTPLPSKGSPTMVVTEAGISTAPADSAKDFTVAANVKSVYLRSRTTGKFTRDEITRLANLRELTNYSVNKEDETPEP